MAVVGYSSSLGKQIQLLLKPSEDELGLQDGVYCDNYPNMPYEALLAGV